jgi:methyl-accepting chemotaxis protein
MKWFYAMQIRTKLLFGFGIVALIAGGIGAIADVNMKMLDDRDTMLYEKATLPQQYLVVASTAFQELVLLNQKLRTDNSPASLAAAENERTVTVERVEKYLKRYEATLTDSSAIAGMGSLSTACQKYFTETSSYHHLLRIGKADDAKKLHHDGMEKDQKAVSGMMLATMEANATAVQSLRDENTDIFESIRALMFIIVATAMVIALGLGLYYSFVIRRDLAQGMPLIEEQSLPPYATPEQRSMRDAEEAVADDEALAPMFTIVGPAPKTVAAVHYATVTPMPTRSAQEAKHSDAPAIPNQPTKKMRVFFDDTIGYDEFQVANYR